MHGLLIAWSHFVQVLQFFTPKLTIYIESEISATLTASFFSFIFNCVSLLHHCSLFMHLHTARQWLRSKHKLLYLHKIKTEPQLYNKQFSGGSSHSIFKESEDVAALTARTTSVHETEPAESNVDRTKCCQAEPVKDLTEQAKLVCWSRYCCT